MGGGSDELAELICEDAERAVETVDVESAVEKRGLRRPKRSAQSSNADSELSGEDACLWNKSESKGDDEEVSLSEWTSICEGGSKFDWTCSMTEGRPV